MSIKMNEVLMSITNGQRRQALNQMHQNDIDFVDLLDMLEKKEILAMVRVAERVGYISYNSANLRGY